jgi:aspartate-semialdehyde dehydrogenase
MSYRIAVVGATGNVGREMMNVLMERRFPVADIHALASRRSIGTEVSFGDKTIRCQDLEQFDFSKADICLMSAGSSVAKE